MPRESSTKNDNVTSSSDQNTGQHGYNFQAEQTLSMKANNGLVKPSGPSYGSKGASGHQYMPYGVRPKPKWAEKSIPDLQTMLPTSYRNVGVQTMDAGKYHQLAFKANCGTDSGQVDGWASKGLVSELKIKIKKLERDVNHYAGEMSKYQVYRKNECQSADADRYDLGEVSQTSQLSPSLYWEYGECSSTNTGLCTETSAFSS